MIRQVAAERGAHRGSHLPIKGSEQVLVEKIPVDAHVVHEHGHISALHGENHLGWGLIEADDRRAHLITGSNRLPGAHVDALKQAKGGPQRRGGRVRDGQILKRKNQAPQNVRRVMSIEFGVYVE